MNTGQLNKLILIQTLQETVVNGDVTQSWSAGVYVRASVVQVDGTLYLSDNEVIGRGVYKISLWDNNYSENIRIGYDSKTLYPIRPFTRNLGIGSRLVEVTIVAATKLGDVNPISSTSITADNTVITADNTVVTADNT